MSVKGVTEPQSRNGARPAPPPSAIGQGEERPVSEHQRVPDQLPMSEPTRGIDLGWVKHMMEEEYNARDWREANEDRKSTRLNSSHANISYAVFCLKKKSNQITQSK